MKTFRLSVGLALLAFAGGALAQAAPTKIYIVQLAEAPAATYAGGIAGLAATRPAVGSKLDARSADFRSYVQYLDIKRSSAMSAIGRARMVHTYNSALAGFAAQLTEAQAAALKRSAGVASVVEAEVQQLDTTSTPSFLGLNKPGGAWSLLDSLSRQVKGEDVIIGVIDSGVWPENPSYGDRVDGGGVPLAYNQAGGTAAYGPPPAKWAGTCQIGAGFTSAMCNNKLIGARYYHQTFDNAGAIRTSMEYLSPRDGGGHGTHTSTTAGGNANVPASIDKVGVGSISGIAPRARISSYKVCWQATVAAQTGCYTSDTLKAIDDAINDGVDVINYSISGTQTNFADPVELAFLNAASVGIYVAASAGNSGPGNQVAHMSPWLTTVAASTHDRFTNATVTLGSGANGGTGPSYQSSGVPAGTPLIRSIDAGVVAYASLTQTEKTALERCYLPADGGTANTALDPSKANGKMVVCYRGGNVLVNKAAVVKAAGGVAMILQNVPAIGGTGASGTTTLLQPYVIPTVHLLTAQYAPINNYILANLGTATAAMSAAVQQPNVVAPVMASFSSRGPNKGNVNILKPDISGPGVDIIAGYLDTSLTQAQHDGIVIGNFTAAANAASLQGTSMSSPHMAGAAALMKQLYPTWTPWAIKSALMTTTTGIKLANGNADPDRWGYGAGHMNPNDATNPGLVYDTTKEDYGRFLCGLSLTPPAGVGNCGTLGSVAAQDLNLASITAGAVPGTQTLTRKVTNVTGAQATYNASVAGMTGWTVLVSPAQLVIPAGQTKSFTVKLTRNGAALNAYTFGSLTWTHASTLKTVVSPLTARAIGFTAPAQVSDTRTSGSGSKVFSVVSAYTGGMAVSPTGLVPAVVNSNTVATGQAQCYNTVVPTGALLARFQLFNEDTQGGAATDLDLDVFNGPNGTGANVGSSGSGSSDEIVTLTGPAAGTYSACVTGFNAPGGKTYKLSSWVVGPTVGTQSLRAAGPRGVYAGSAASVGLGWSVPAGQRYLGTVRFFDDTSTLIGTTVVAIDNR